MFTHHKVILKLIKYLKKMKLIINRVSGVAKSDFE